MNKVGDVEKADKRYVIIVLEELLNCKNPKYYNWYPLEGESN